MHSMYFSLFLFLFQQPAPDPPVPTLISIEPSSVVDGSTVAVTFRGAGFVARQSAPEISASAAGNAIPFGSAGAAQWIDENTMTFLLRVQVPPGTYYVDVATTAFGNNAFSYAVRR